MLLKRCIVLYAQDVLSQLQQVKALESEKGKYETLHQLSREGASGFLVWRKSQSTKDFPSDVEQVGQILGREQRGSSFSDPPVALASEFKGAKCCLLSNSDAVFTAFAEGTFDRAEAFGGRNSSSSHLEDAFAPALEGPVRAALEEDFDFIFIHTSLHHHQQQEQENRDSLQALDDGARLLVDKFVDERTMLVLLLGDGQRRTPLADHGIDLNKNDKKNATPKATSGGGGGGYPLPYTPKQSYQFTGGEMIEDWCEEGLLLSVHFSPVNHIRKDLAQRLSVTQALTVGGNGAILAIHFLKSVMYNIQKAPKYGS